MKIKPILFEDIKPHEITLAKCGSLSLICIAYPQNDFMAYELRSNEQKLLETTSLRKAILFYNKHL